MSLIDYQTVADHFIIAALWADCPKGTHPRATRKSKARALQICTEFIDANLSLFNAAMERADIGYGSHPDAGSAEASFGHDLYLTLYWHGVGFRDRRELRALDADANMDCIDDIGTKLAEACNDSKFDLLQCPDFYRGWMYLS